LLVELRRERNGGGELGGGGNGAAALRALLALLVSGGGECGRGDPGPRPDRGIGAGRHRPPPLVAGCHAAASVRRGASAREQGTAWAKAGQTALGQKGGRGPFSKKKILFHFYFNIQRNKVTFWAFSKCFLEKVQKQKLFQFLISTTFLKGSKSNSC
jgi:hypothetical protein